MQHETGTSAHNNILEHAELVRRVAKAVHARLPPSVDRADLEQVGMVALIECLERFDADRGVTFQVFARHRVRGAILDWLRGEDWVPHSVRRKAQAIDEARRALRRATHRRPQDGELAERMGLGLEEWHAMARSAEIRPLLSLDAPMAGENATPMVEQVPHRQVRVDDDVANSELRDHTRRAIANLPPREAEALTLHYLQDLPLREVGDRLGVTESRACQLCGQGIQRLRRKLKATTAPRERAPGLGPMGGALAC